MTKQTFVTTTLCILLVLYVASVFLAPSAVYAPPNVRICKSFLDTSDPPPYEMRTLYHWDIEIRISTDVPLTSANIYDRFGGELKIDHITVPGGPTYTFNYLDYSEEYPTKDATVTITGVSGTHDLDKTGVRFGARPYGFFIYWSGKTHKIHFQWLIGRLELGDISVIIGVSTDLNPGGKQEFTSPCEHCLNSGATLHARCGRGRISAYSERLCVKVACAGRLLIDKFNDANGNGQFDSGESKITEWEIYVIDPLGAVTTYYTPVDIEVTEYGTYIITEEDPAGWTQTAVFVNGVPQDVNPMVTVTINLDDACEVVYGNYKPPPPPIGVSLYIDPISLPVDANIDFTWTITSPPDVTPVSVVLRLTPPGENPFVIYTGTSFPDDFAKTITWTATTPTDMWWAHVTYTYEYLGITYTAGPFGTFYVTP